MKSKSGAQLGDLKTLWQRSQAGHASSKRAPAGEGQATSPATPVPAEEQTLVQTSPHRPRLFAEKKNPRAIHAGAPPDDIDFKRTMQNERVVPLPPAALRRAVMHVARPAPRPKQKLRDERETMALAKYGDAPPPASWDVEQEQDDQTFLRTGQAPDVLRKLRRGQWAIQRELDLHGLNTDEAHDVLLDFLLDARTRGLRCVRIIHGKGLSSPDRAPVLKSKVRRWLSMWADVLAYCEPEHHAGGSGVVVVLLRGH